MPSSLRSRLWLLLLLSGIAVAATESETTLGGQEPPPLEVVTREERIAVEPASTMFRLRNPHGDVRLRVTEQPMVAIHATIQRIGETPLDPTFEIGQRDGVFELVIRYPDEDALLGSGDHGYGRVDLGVWVPARLALDLETTDGLLQVRRAAAAVRARTTSGELQVTAGSGMDLASVSGDVSARQYSGRWEDPVRLKSERGHVYASIPAFADIELSVRAGGRIEVQSGLPQPEPAEGGGMQLNARFGAALRGMQIEAPMGDVYLYRVVADDELSVEDVGARAH
jgi:hypothetical protein